MRRSFDAIGLLVLLALVFGVTVVIYRKNPDSVVTEHPGYATGNGLQPGLITPSPDVFTFVPPTPSAVPTTGGTSGGGGGGGGTVRRGAPAKPVVCPASPTIPARTVTAGYAYYKNTDVYAHPTDKTPIRTLKNPTRDQQRLVVLVRGLYGHDWIKVQFAERPNGSTGWIKAITMELVKIDMHIVVEKCKRTLTVWQDGHPVYRAPVAVGKASTPTPISESFVDFVWKSDKPRGSYGPYMLSVAAFSEVLHTFGDGGIGQIAIHGTNARSSVGQASSNGCIRMYNENVSEIVKFVRAGTPVTVAP